jgi:hypothetical protein
MYNQMEQFEDGGLKDEGGAVDEVSGNEVPVGGTKKGVRDDIPAMVSEGEFIFPEDVTRYIGLDKLMQLRQDAKMGLKKMEAMGQMGNGDEATMEDDMPFEMADLIIVGGPMEEPQEKYKGGVLHAQQGTYVGQQQQPATGIAGYQPSVYANRAPINPYQYQAPASAFTPPTYQNTQVAPSQPTSGYMPKFVGQGVTRKTVTGRDTPRVTAEEFVEDIYLEVKYINPETGDIRTFKFYEGEPISTIPAGYVPYEEGQDPAEGTTPPEGDVATTTTQVSRDRDDDPTPPPPPFNWDEATPEAIVNEVNKIQGPAGSVVTGLAFALNPVLGGLAFAATKANEKQTLTKLGEMLKDKDFVKKMSDAGQLKKLRDSLTGLEEKTKGEDKGTVDIDLLGQIGTLIKGVTGALKDVFTPKQEKDAIAGAVSSAADQDPTKKDNTITIVDDPFATSAAAPYFKDDTLTREGLASLATTGEDFNKLESTSVLGDTSLINQQGTSYSSSPTDVVSSRPVSLEESLFSYAPLAPISVDRISELIGNIDTTDPVKLSESIISMSKDVAQPSRPLEDLPSAEQDSTDPLTMAQTAMKAMTREREEQREQVFEPEFLKGLGGPPSIEEQAAAESQVSLDVFGGEGTPQVTIPTPAPTPAPTVTTAPRRESRDPGPSGAEVAKAAADRAAAASAVAKSEGVSAPTSGGARSVSTPTGNVETYASKVERGGGFNKGGLAGKPKKKPTSKKRGLAARK